MSLLTWSSQMVQIALNHLNMVMKLVFGHKDTFGHKDIFGHKDTFGHKDKKVQEDDDDEQLTQVKDHVS